MTYSQLEQIKENVLCIRQALNEYVEKLDPKRGNPRSEYERGFLDAVEFLIKRLSANIAQLEQGVISLETELQSGAVDHERPRVTTEG